MFKSLRIKNFQSHNDTLLHFVEGVNIIVGLPNKGKTALFRAIQLLLKNRPLGASDYYPNYKSGKVNTEIGIEFDDCKIDLVKSSHMSPQGPVLDNTEYTVEGHSSFTKVGTNVPDLVSHLTNIDEINIQNQHDPSFLITSSSGEIARTINRITHLERADQWISGLTSKINKTKTEIDILKLNVTDLEDGMDQFDKLDYLEKLIKVLKNIDIRKVSCYKKLSGLESIEEKHTLLTRKLYFLQKQLETNELVTEALGFCREMTDIQHKIDALTKYLSLKQRLDYLKIDTIEPLQHLYEQVASLQVEDSLRKIDLLTSIKNRYEKLCDILRVTKEKHRKLKNKYLKLLEKEQICPTCFSEIDKGAIDKIAENL